MIGVLAQFVTIPVISGFAFWLVVVAFVLLLLATYLPYYHVIEEDPPGAFSTGAQAEDPGYVKNFNRRVA
ncbi:MAG: hypothetical protein MAG451_01580 [Anaerolineales bacterium]|nr:hypothetical protein [Anaerolineales bacterium]